MTGLSKGRRSADRSRESGFLDSSTLDDDKNIELVDAEDFDFIHGLDEA